MNVHVLLNGIMVRPWTRPWSVIHGLWPWSKSVVKAAKSMVQTMDSDHGQRPWSLTMMPFNKTWLSMDYHGLVPLDIHGYPWTSMVKMSLIRLGMTLCIFLQWNNKGFHKYDYLEHIYLIKILKRNEFSEV